MTLFFEMNQAVPGSLASPLMESSFECQVPSPSQWSDPCRSPPSLHSPTHFPADLDKLKEEPFSPQPQYPRLTSPLSFYSLTIPLMSRESIAGEASLDLAELLAENQALQTQVHQQQLKEQQQQQLKEQQQQQLKDQQQQQLKDQHQQQLKEQQQVKEQQQQQHQAAVRSVQDVHFDFLDSLVDVKREFEEYSPPFVPVVSSALTSASSPLVPLSISVSEPVTASTLPVTVSTASGNGGDVLCIALEHYRQSFQEVSKMLNISKDPSKWTVQNVRSWLQFEASKLKLPMPALDQWQIPGQNLVQLTESQFRELIPEGGNLFYANLEIWKAAFRTSIPMEPIRRISPPSSSHIQQLYQIHPTVTQSSTPGTSTYHSQQTGQQIIQRGLQVYQVPAAMLHSPIPAVIPARMPSPGAHSLLQLPTTSPIPQTIQSTPTVTLSQTRTPIQSPPIQVPTSVVQGEAQSVPKLQLVPGPSKAFSPSKPDTQPKQISRSFLEEACMDMPSLLQDEPAPPKVLTAQQTPVEPPPERTETESMEEQPTTSTSGRGGTHIHLWQFLKELLQKPQEHGACIRWLDRSKGVFKIEDSVRVARLWGKRKNRPAMNYDKLSRSIRQYYKKGIMKKTERSQRLVYQFCHPYSL